MENLNNVPSTGTFGGSVSKINSNFDLVVNAINSLEYQTTRSKGILNYGQNPATVFPNAVAGDWCMILSQGNVFPATIKTYNGSKWSGSGTWNPEGVDLTQYAQKSEMTTAIANSLAQATARMGYGECTVSGTTLAVSIPNFILPTSGGTIHIKMSAAGTGASTLSINGTTAKTLWYNGKAVSSTNTWEADEIISVFYDGTRFMASNSQGGGGKAEKIIYDNSQSGLAATNIQAALDEAVYDTDIVGGLIDISNIQLEAGFINAYSNRWEVNANNKGVLVPVTPNKIYEIITGNDGTRYAFLTTNTWSARQTPSYAQDSTITQVLSHSSSGILTAPSNAAYLFIYIYADGRMRDSKLFIPTLGRIDLLEQFAEGTIVDDRTLLIPAINAYKNNVIELQSGDIITAMDGFSGTLLLSDSSDFSHVTRISIPSGLPYAIRSDFSYYRLSSATDGCTMTIAKSVEKAILELNDELFVWDTPALARKLDNFMLSDTAIWASNNGRNVLIFKVGFNKHFSVEGTASVACASCKLMDGTVYSSSWETVGLLRNTTGGTYGIEGKTTSEYEYVAITVDANSDYSCLVRTTNDGKEIPGLQNKVMLLDSITGENAYSISADSLTNGNSLVLGSFPYHIKKNVGISFSANITSFNTIQVGKGYNKYRGKWIEINGTDVILKSYENSVSTIETKAHGLTISTYIKVSMFGDNNGVLHLVIQSFGGYFSTTFEGWGFEANYEAFARSVNSSLASVKLNATCSDLKCPVWVIGDSYCGVSDARWPYYMKEWGYWNYMICALAGQTSQQASNDFDRLVKGGTPKYLLWLLGMNDTLDKYKQYFGYVKGFCESHGITLIAGLTPTVPSIDNEGKKQYIIDNGVRYINFYSAVGADSSGNWYDGYLSNDNVHPTQLGAQALATQVLVDFPEIMEYRNG